MAYLVTGCGRPVEHCDVEPRYEIRTLQEEHPYQFSLFVQAMQHLHNMNNGSDRDKPNSWYQIAGIHGVPYKRWKGDPGDEQNIQQLEGTPPQWRGYCYHDSVHFPTWHRVLMLLIEQAISEEAIAKAAEIEKENAGEGSTWTEAAQKLRFPYWDWTRPDTVEGLPPVLCDEYVSIKWPGQADMKTVHNPLEHFQFPDNIGDDLIPKPNSEGSPEYLSKWKRTWRWPDKNDSPFKSDYAKIKSVMADQGDFGRAYNGLMEQVRALYAYPPIGETPTGNYNENYWELFANPSPQSYNPDPKGMPRVSIASPHNAVHLDLGGTGTMAYDDYAAFDPIFYLHHCNIDRLYALWEYVYPEYFIGQDGWLDKDGSRKRFATLQGTYSKPKGSVDNNKTSLAPFHKSEDTYWSPEDARSLIPEGPYTSHTKKYTYPVIEATIKDGDKLKTVTVDVKAKYDPAMQFDYIRALQKHFGGKSANKLEAYMAPFFRTEIISFEPSSAGVERLTVVKNFRQFVVVAELNEFIEVVRGSYRLELLVSAKGMSEPIVANSVSIFGRIYSEVCEGCQSRRSNPRRVRGIMYLEQSLVRGLLGPIGGNRSDTPAGETLRAIQLSIQARLVEPNGTPFASAKLESTEDSGRQLRDQEAPILWLSSIAIAHPEGQPDGLAQFVDYQQHLPLLVNKWRFIPKSASTTG